MNALDALKLQIRSVLATQNKLRVPRDARTKDLNRINARSFSLIWIVVMNY